MAFVEVKWRRDARDLEQSVDHYRLRRVAAAAEALAPRYARAGDDLRIDVLLLAPRHMAAPDRQCLAIRRLEAAGLGRIANAWQSGA